MQGLGKNSLRATVCGHGKRPVRLHGGARKPGLAHNGFATCVREKYSLRRSDPVASWRSGYAADCKSVYTGSIPVLASKARLFSPSHLMTLTAGRLNLGQTELRTCLFGHGVMRVAGSLNFPEFMPVARQFLRPS